jgi:hypothetical protein
MIFKAMMCIAMMHWRNPHFTYHGKLILVIANIMKWINEWLLLMDLNFHGILRNECHHNPSNLIMNRLDLGDFACWLLTQLRTSILPSNLRRAAPGFSVDHKGLPTTHGREIPSKWLVFSTRDSERMQRVGLDVFGTMVPSLTLRDAYPNWCSGLN